MSVINTNITSLIAQKNLNASQSALTTAMERLSSGMRINSAKDDAAGQAIANRMSSQITGLGQAQRNANDGISVAQTAEGALNQINDNLQRIRELSVQAANDTNSPEDRTSIQAEINQRLDEIDRISEETNFNGTKVLASDQTLKIQVGSKDGESISIDLQQINKSTLGLSDLNVGNIVLSKDLTAVTEGASFDVMKAADVQANTYTPAPLTATGVYATTTGYAVKASDDNYYELATNPVTGQLTWDSATTALDPADVDVAGGPLTEVNITSTSLPAAVVDSTSGLAPVLAGGVTLSGLHLRNDEAAAPVETVAVDYNGNVASGEKLVSYLDAADNKVQYAVISADGLTATAATVDSTTGAVTLGAALAGADDTAAKAAGTAGFTIANGDSVVEQGTDMDTVAYSNYATLGSDGKYYAVTVGVDETAVGFDAADATTWTLTATVDENAMVEVSAGNIVAGGAVSEVATAKQSVASNADLLQLADEGPSPMAVTADGVYALAAGDGYAVKGSDGSYYAADVDADGKVTWDSSSTALNAADVDTGAAVTSVKTGDVDAATFDGLATGETLHSFVDKDGNTQYVVKGGTEEAPTYTYATLSAPSADGVVTVTKQTDTDGSSKDATVDPLSMLDNAIAQVDALRSDLGAIQNRFDSAITNLKTNETNLSAARSRIEDADYAVEVANMTKAQILQQAGTSVLAQANQIPQGVLSLLG